MDSGNVANPHEHPRAGTTDVERLYKVAFDLPENLARWARASTERLWTEKTPVRMESRVCNVPFYVKGIALGDIVRVRADNERRELVFEEFVAPSGHSTVRLIILDKTELDRIGSLLKKFECAWEVDGSGILWAIDVPPAVAYDTLLIALMQLKEAGKIEIEESAVAQGHRKGLDTLGQSGGLPTGG
ncbi:MULTISPECIES: DUF4265 domain-containing protein [unclassified Terrabacter]|jgi:hypothetical protein|uniref:DUF4265 domain-containing protein n=1 Tax=unclassified Terrabacter TaxID=2630222 RepID=UPI0009E7392E|nr:DUF4265 domain-containing protein [Terrabacter sp. Root85]